MKLNLTILALLCCCGAMAQQKFIEVTASDTVLAKANLFVYKITLTPEDDFSEFGGPSKTRRSMEDIMQLRRLKAEHTFDSLKKVLKAEGFNVCKSSLGDSFNIYQHDMPFFSARTVTHSIDSLGLLYRQLRNQKGLIGSLELAVAVPDSSYQKSLFKKILAQAWTKAENIAACNNQHVQGILAVTENKTEEGGTGGWTSYPPLSALGDSMIPGWHTTIRAQASIVIADPISMDWYPLAGTFTVRFSVE
jgi:hypothetical protein